MTLTSTAPTTVGTSVWNIDPTHSSAEFAVKHMVFTTAKGVFRDLEGIVEFDEANPAASKVEATIQVASIDTRDANRDAHLRGDDFFNAEQFPTITFRSNRVEVEDENRGKIYGELTIRDVTKEVVLDTEYHGQLLDAYGKQRASFTAQTEISRKEFGLRWNALLETGAAVVADKVKITLDIAAVRED